MRILLIKEIFTKYEHILIFMFKKTIIMSITNIISVTYFLIKEIIMKYSLNTLTLKKLC